jgi:LysM repeat protein
MQMEILRKLFVAGLVLAGFTCAQTGLSAQSVTAIDTLNTSEPSVKIVLYSDYTWKYVKDSSQILSSELFTSNWSSAVPNPYRKSLDSFPDEVRIWVVDTLNQYHYPCAPGKIYSGFGYRHRHNHQGVDLPLKYGDPVYAAFDGKVRMSKYYHGYGNLVIIRHTNGLETFYAHLSKRLVAEGDCVRAGQVIGQGGATGRASGVHLHFETRYNGFAFDPQWLVDCNTGMLRHRLLVLNKKYLSPRSNYDQDFNDENAMSDKEAESVVSMPDDGSSDTQAAPTVNVAAGTKVNIPAGTNPGVTTIRRDSARVHGVDSSKYSSKDSSEQTVKPKTTAKSTKVSVRGHKYHTVRQGDTLYGIARNNNTNVKALCRLNGISSSTKLHPGQKIIVK